MTESNILSFPKNRIIRDPDQNNEELTKLKSNSVRNFADALTEEIAETLLSLLTANGIEMEDDRFAKDFHFLVGVSNATIYRTLNLEHQFHSFIDEHVKLHTIDETEVDKV